MILNIHKTYDITQLSRQEFDTIRTGLDLIIQSEHLAPDTAAKLLTALNGAPL